MQVCITCDELSPRFRIEILERLIQLLKCRDVKGSFFVVPNWHGEYYLGDYPIWCDKIKQIRKEGHEIGLHGYYHNFMEMGFQYFYFLNYEKQLKLIRKGREDLESLVGVSPVGFRGPWFSGNTNTIRALDNLRFIYDSSRVEMFGVHTLLYAFPLLFHAYNIPLISKLANKIEINLYRHVPHKVDGTEVIEIPIRGEYTWLLPKNTASIMGQILRRDYLRSKKRNDVFVLITHVSGLTDGGFAVLKEFLEFAKKDGAEFLTLEEVSRLQNKNS